jgi:single-strand DNA-binding protein
MNTIIIAGHLGADPETRFTPQGRKVTNFRLAVNVWQNGQEETIWYRVAAWGEGYDNLIAHMKKGSAVIVTGNFRKPTIWTDSSGKNHVQLEVDAHHLQFPRFGKSQQGGEAAQPQAQSNGQQGYEYSAPSDQGSAPQMAGNLPAEDDLPF